MKHQNATSMKNILFIAVIIFFGSQKIQSQEKETFNLTIEFIGMKSDKGSLFVALYNEDSKFLKKNHKGEIVEIKNKKATVTFKDIPKGFYAVSSFHDENDNKKMDTNFLGIPKEPTGMSNDAKGFMGPPKYKDAKFILSENKTIAIKVN